jgi:hypothetical protein
MDRTRILRRERDPWENLEQDGSARNKRADKKLRRRLWEDRTDWRLHPWICINWKQC